MKSYLMIFYYLLIIKGEEYQTIICSSFYHKGNKLENIVNSDILSSDPIEKMMKH